MIWRLAELVWRRLAAGLLAGLLLCLAPVLAEQPRTGLMWNRTGLPAVFPLQVKTPAGADYYLVLSGSGGDALAAYIEGGAFFKVLVPPGRYVLRIASGSGWQSEDRLFGPETLVFEMPEPLDFAVRGAGIKAGHLVTLARQPRGGGLRAEVKGQFVCQIASLESPAPAQPLAELPGGFTLGGGPHGRAVLHLRWRLGVAPVQPGTPDAMRQRSLFVLGHPNLPRQGPEAFSPDLPELQPEPRSRSYSVRSLYCG
ncbi:hypothetical protein [Leisingera daeponensis]|uniref:hypothetical protein n=1 Tax=Leisingera daeponensis TaxID=405746 RepID=UPI001C95E7BF|nr:hypothetical protein [Leisingera daeponensis]MBY6055580.1 hypothetical protein [Leisingera daeponensis]